MTQLSEEEHVARAMLLGLRYHHGNGEPFYYKMLPDKTPDAASFVDAITLVPMADPALVESYTGKEIRSQLLLWNDFGQGKL